ncbi:LysR family transcriptional regulator [Marinomonas sp. A79]|uniref:LysR family transcriptional regulator n=1 Tax=Marinomonas vulgaris TaxID=2823372 RepID=A0ABS5HGJ2_9GAMM|nr:LysR substrate-binding domain-containing protein [Marinomonas vulgaris]MBR7890114.1 LysR family transcriptional regulator [Marinomonas vulgaris]
MELKWLEDYLALAKHGSFSKAAEARFVTQPAFSRRIRSLENWLGVSLVDRAQYPTSLTDAGKAFLEQAESLKNQIYASRNQLTCLVNDQAEIVVMSQHSLAVSFMPDWLEQIEPMMGDTLIRVNTDNLHDSLESFLAGTGDFLLCFSSPEILKQLDRDDVECLKVATDRIVPVTAVSAHGEPIYSTNQSSLRLVTYPKDSFLGRLIAPVCSPNPKSGLTMQKVCENALAEGLKALVIKGYGVAWLPQSLVKKELDEHTMAILPEPLQSIDLNINIYRLKGKPSAVSARFWQYLLTQYTDNA